MTEPVVIPGIPSIKDYVGVPLGPGDWVTVTQQQIDAFATATGDRQWIHVDVERARRESPFERPIAHGYLTMSLASASGGAATPTSGGFPPTLDVVKNTGSIPRKSSSAFILSMRTEPTIPRHPTNATLSISFSCAGTAQ